MGCAVHTRLPRGKGYTTLEYKVNIIRANSTQVEPLSSHPARWLHRLAGRSAWRVTGKSDLAVDARRARTPSGPLEFSPNPARRRLPVAPLRTARRRLVSRKIGAAERLYLGGTCSRPAGPETGVLRATGEATHVGRRTGVAEGRLVAAAGRLYAQGSTTCLIFDF